jgi:hypothetical protein
LITAALDRSNAHHKKVHSDHDDRVLRRPMLAALYLPVAQGYH